MDKPTTPHQTPICGFIKGCRVVSPVFKKRGISILSENGVGQDLLLSRGGEVGSFFRVLILSWQFEIGKVGRLHSEKVGRFY